MVKPLVIRRTIRLNAPPSTVWNALIDPKLTRKYMFGTEAVSDWKPGHSLLWKGVWEGKEKIFVKGNVILNEPQRILSFTVFDPNGDIPDIPSNYTTVTYELVPDDEGTMLLVTQGDYAKVAEGEKRYKESGDGWDTTLIKLKELVEGIPE